VAQCRALDWLERQRKRLEAPVVPEVSSEDSSSKSKDAIPREKSRSVEPGRNEFPTWRFTG